MKERNETLVAPVLSQSSSPTSSFDDRIVVKAYTMAVAFGKQGIGYRLSINRNASWATILEKLENKFDQNGDVGAVGTVRDEDGCLIQNTSELMDNDRIFVCRAGEEWGKGIVQEMRLGLDEEVDEVDEVDGVDEEVEMEQDVIQQQIQSPKSMSTKKEISWASSTYEAPFFRDMRSTDATATVFETRENETLSVTSVGGIGRLVVT